MRQLDTCDFCGGAPEGVFEVVPGDIEGGPVRLALCASCRGTLASVTDPLLDADRRDTSGQGTATESTDPSLEPASSEPTTDEAPDTANASASGDGAAETDDADEREDTTDAGSDSGVTIESQGGGSPARRPDGYAQLLRLLQNRDGAMPKSDLRALATNAYDLSAETFEAAVEAAVENGDVEETASGLRTA
jgi:hypothetical protein